MSNYRHVPTVEIDQNIGWLDHVISDCEFKIDLLRSEKKARARSQAWRKNFKSIVAQFCDDDSLDLDIYTRTKIIQQRLGCEWEYAQSIAERVQKHAKARLRFFRDQQIRLDHGMGRKPVDIAKKHSLTRQQVYNILKKDVKQQWRGKTMYLERLITNNIT